MRLIEVEDERRVTREEAAAQLHRLADQLARHNEIELTRDGIPIHVQVPAEVDLEVELKVGDRSKLEIELKW